MTCTANRPMTGPAAAFGTPREDLDAALTCAIRHLAIASEDLALKAGSIEAAGRYTEAARRFRDLAGGNLGQPETRAALRSTPMVRGRDEPDGCSVLELLVTAWGTRSPYFPVRGIDPTMVEAGRQLLGELAWRFPN